MLPLLSESAFFVSVFVFLAILKVTNKSNNISLNTCIVYIILILDNHKGNCGKNMLLSNEQKPYFWIFWSDANTMCHKCGVRPKKCEPPRQYRPNNKGWTNSGIDIKCWESSENDKTTNDLPKNLKYIVKLDIADFGSNFWCKLFTKEKNRLIISPDNLLSPVSRDYVIFLSKLKPMSIELDNSGGGTLRIIYRKTHQNLANSISYLFDPTNMKFDPTLPFKKFQQGEKIVFFNSKSYDGCKKPSVFFYFDKTANNGFITVQKYEDSKLKIHGMSNYFIEYIRPKKKDEKIVDNNSSKNGKPEKIDVQKIYNKNKVSPNKSNLDKEIELKTWPPNIDKKLETKSLEPNFCLKETTSTLKKQFLNEKISDNCSKIPFPNNFHQISNVSDKYFTKNESEFKVPFTGNNKFPKNAETNVKNFNNKQGNFTKITSLINATHSILKINNAYSISAPTNKDSDINNFSETDYNGNFTFNGNNHQKNPLISAAMAGIGTALAFISFLAFIQSIFFIILRYEANKQLGKPKTKSKLSNIFINIRKISI